jgi:hypothetical protein
MGKGHTRQGHKHRHISSCLAVPSAQAAAAAAAGLACLRLHQLLLQTLAICVMNPHAQGAPSGLL